MVTLIIFVSLVGFLFLRYTVVCYHTSDSYLPDYLVCRTLEFVLNFLTFQAAVANTLDCAGQLPHSALCCFL